ncbi:MAG: transcriptional regulator [Muribaculaceae bacterium]
MMKELNPLIHSQLRLAILSTLMSVEEADFMYLKDVTRATMGNLSVQITRLSEAGYIEVEKGFRDKRPRTVCRMTEAGREAFAEYVEALHAYIAPAASGESPDGSVSTDGLVTV